MPLLDHFHPPVSSSPWESFHTRWATAIGNHLRGVLPRGYRTRIMVHLGAQGEEFSNGPVGEGGLAVQTWAPPAVTLVLPLTFTDSLEVQVIDQQDDARLVGVIELVSPSNTDRDTARHAFATKCAAYLQRGLGLVVVDIVTSRLANMHNELVRLLSLDTSLELGIGTSLHATSYRPAQQGKVGRADVWVAPLVVGRPLPTVPLPILGNDRLFPLDLETTYTETCRWEDLV
jgi:hypothetical protein